MKARLSFGLMAAMGFWLWAAQGAAGLGYQYNPRPWSDRWLRLSTTGWVAQVTLQFTNEAGLILVGNGTNAPLWTNAIGLASLAVGDLQVTNVLAAKAAVVTNTIDAATVRAGDIAATNGLTAKAAAVTNLLTAGALQLTTNLASLYGGWGQGNFANVLDFGAVADASTDNTAAFLAAETYVAARGGGIVFIPAGTNKYLLNHVCTNRNILFLGEGGPYWGLIGGAYGTVLAAYNSLLPAMRFGDDGSLLAAVRIQGIQFWGATDALGVMVLGCNGLTFRDCLFTGFTNNVLVTGGTNYSTYHTTFENCHFAASNLGSAMRGLRHMRPYGGSQSCGGTTLIGCKLAGAASGYLAELDGAGITLVGSYCELNYSGHGFLWPEMNGSATNWHYTNAIYGRDTGIALAADGTIFDPSGSRTNVMFTIQCITNIMEVGTFLRGRSHWTAAIQDAATQAISLTEYESEIRPCAIFSRSMFAHEPVLIGRVLLQPSNSWPYAVSNFVAIDTSGLMTISNNNGGLLIGVTGNVGVGTNDTTAATGIFGELTNLVALKVVAPNRDAGSAGLLEMWSGAAGTTPWLILSNNMLGIGKVPSSALDATGNGALTGGLGVGTNAPSAGEQIMGNPTGVSWSLNGVQGVCSNGYWGFGIAPDLHFRLNVSGNTYCSGTVIGSYLKGYPATTTISNTPMKCLELWPYVGGGLSPTNGFGQRIQCVTENRTPAYNWTNALYDSILVDASSNAPISAIAFSVNNGSQSPSEIMRIVGNKVGINTNAPSTALEIVGIATVSSNVVAGGVFSSGGNAGKSVTNTWYSVSADLLTVVTNVQTIHGGLMTSWLVNSVETMVSP